MARMLGAARGLLLLLAAAGLGLLLTRPPWPLAAAERLYQALAFRALAPVRPPHPRLVLIAITEATLDAYPYRSPVDRGFLAGLVDALAGAGVAAIGLDLLLDRTTEPAKDAALRQAIRRRAPPVVAITAGPETALEPARQRVLDGFLDGVATGTANLARDVFDGQVRWHLPQADGRPSLPVALAQAVGAAVPDQPFLIDWQRSAAGPVAPAYPAEAVPLLPAEWLRGRIALIGSMLPGSDEHRTPAAAFGKPSFGVEIHAQVLAQLLDGRAGAAAWWREPAALLLLAGLGLLAGARLAGRRFLLALAGLALGYPAAALAALAAGGAAWPGLGPVLAALLAGGGARAWRSRAERRDRQALRGLFSRFLGAEVAEALLRDRALFMAGGRPKPQELVATVLFSDIAGFTAICEALPPAPLIDWLDRYIDVMVAVSVAHGGVVLRFVGDGMLVVFGVPVPRPDAAGRAADAAAAARCALAMEQAMEALNAEWRAAGLPEAGLRIGIHTGPLVAGSLGRGERMEFCLLGDTANVGARLEQLGKQHGGGGRCTILVGEPTWRLLGGAFPGRRIGELSLRNRVAGLAAWRIDSGR
ncbi:CHASE2 domain-containing protein [Paeniroseomonas aquatica]